MSGHGHRNAALLVDATVWRDRVIGDVRGEGRAAARAQEVSVDLVIAVAELMARAPRESGQLLLFPEFSKPIARLQAFRGGRMPPAVAAEAEFRRRQLDLSQRELAALVGLCQGQYANAIRGHSDVSPSD